MAMPDIPMYVFTGFLESGKTKFIQETLEDERFNTGERFPEGSREIFSIKKGESWVVDRNFTFEQPVSFQLREFDDIGGSDNIGTVDLGSTPGTFTRTLDGDASDYKVTYTLTVG